MSEPEESEGRNPQKSGGKHHKKVRITHSSVLRVPHMHPHIRFIYRSFKKVVSAEDKRSCS